MKKARAMSGLWKVVVGRRPGSNQILALVGNGEQVRAMNASTTPMLTENRRSRSRALERHTPMAAVNMALSAACHDPRRATPSKCLLYKCHLSLQTRPGRMGQGNHFGFTFPPETNCAVGSLSPISLRRRSASLTRIIFLRTCSGRSFQAVFFSGFNEFFSLIRRIVSALFIGFLAILAPPFQATTTSLLDFSCPIAFGP